MSDPLLPSPPAPRAIALRLAPPLLLFSLALSMLLLASWHFLLPRFLTVEVNGEAKSGSEIMAYKAALEADIRGKEEKRDAFLLPVHDARFLLLGESRHTRRSVARALQDIRQSARNMGDGVVVLSRIAVHQQGTLELAGDVGSVGPRSMTMLAAFVDALEHLPGVSSVTEPRYERIDDPKTGPHSPFTLSLQMQP